MELKDRVSKLIELVYGGNVMAAARGIDAGTGQMPERMLYRIANGQTTNPRIDVLRVIADHFGTTTDWLVSGRGSTPSTDDRFITDLRAVVRALDLPGESFDALQRMLLRMADLFGLFLPGAKGADPEAMRKGAAAASDASKADMAALVGMLRDLIAAHGAERMRQHLIAVTPILDEHARAQARVVARHPRAHIPAVGRFARPAAPDAT